MRTARIFQLAVIVAFWVSIVLEFESSPFVIGMIKPLIVFGKIHHMRAALQVFVSALADAAVVVGLVFTIAIGSAILMLLLFHDKYDDSFIVGTTANWFLDALVAMFVSFAPFEVVH